jgi:four helix bundle protein
MSEVRSQSKPGLIRHFTDLIVWRKANELSLDVFRLSRKWPVEERYSLTDQVRRSSRSIGANLAEAWGKRRYEAAFVAKLVDADAEAHETEHWLINAQQHGYITADDFAKLKTLLDEIGRMLGSMIARPTTFITRATPRLESAQPDL